MQCEDNGKLRAPLNEVCMTTDIGCVPIVSGKPTCKPQPDELPIAFDPSTTTLWLFSCDTREWIAFGKFSVCQLSALNLDNIKNICDVLNIAVNYGGSGECVQGTVTLGELAQRILECLQLDRKIITIGQGEGNKVKISIEGLPLDPVYVTGVNIWSEGGSGSENDPLVVATYDPICKWPVVSQSVVDAATTKHLGACLDGKMSRVPFPPKPCEYPIKGRSQVDAANEKHLVACLDGEPSRVPFPPEPCEYPQKSEEQVDAATSKNLIACVDGENVKVPYPKYQPPVCESNQLTLDQALAAGSSLTLVACENGTVVRIPVVNSGFFDRDYICVPSVIAAPTQAPLTGTGPLRIGCNGELYVWLCEGGWKEVRFNPNALDNLDPFAVADLCNNFRMMGWYSNTNGDPCVQEVKFTLKQLVDMIAECIPYREYSTFESKPNEVVIHNNKIYKTDKPCCPVVKQVFTNVQGGACISIGTSSLPVVYEARTNSIVMGEALINEGRGGIATASVTNSFDAPALLSVQARTLISLYNEDVKGSSILWINENPQSTFAEMLNSTGVVGDFSRTSDEFPNQVRMPLPLDHYILSGSPASYDRILEPGETANLYFHIWIICNSIGAYIFHTYAFANGYLFNNAVR